MEKENNIGSKEKQQKLLNETIALILKTIEQNPDKRFEIDKLEDFNGKNLIIHDNKKFPTWQKNQNNIYSYLKDIIDLSIKINEGKNDETEQLENWLFTNSCRENESCSYIMSTLHPIIELIEEFNKELEHFLKYEQEKIAMILTKALLENYKKYLEHFWTCTSSELYYGSKKEGFWQAVLWDDIGTLTRIDALSLIDKIIYWIQKNWDGKEAKPNINIAYIGSLDNQDTLINYFSEFPVILNEKKVYPQITFTNIKRKETEIFFIESKKDIKSKSIYNLKSLTDIKSLLGNFDIVLFLDESYFYKQRQCEKDLHEKGALIEAKWWLEEAIHENEDRVRKYYALKSGVFKNIGLWLNGRFERKSSYLSFDGELFSMLQQAYLKECDVYLYSSQGDPIHDTLWENEYSCMLEYHQGKELKVYKMFKGLDYKDTINTEIMEMSHKTENHVTMNVFDLVRNLDSSLIPILFKDIVEDNQKIMDIIHILRNTVLNVTFQKIDEKSLELILQVGSSKNHLAKQFVESFINLCQAENQFAYIKNILSFCLYNEFLYHANSIEAIFYIYLLQKKKCNISSTVSEVNLPPNLFLLTEEKVYARNMIYHCLKKLDDIMIRYMDKLESILLFDFRYKFNFDIIEKRTFRLLLEEFYKCYQASEYIEDRNYLLLRCLHEDFPILK